MLGGGGEGDAQVVKVKPAPLVIIPLSCSGGWA
jgi:hypothetical protein